MRNFCPILLVCSLTVSAQSLIGNRSDEETNEILEQGRIRTEEINRTIRDINRKTQDACDGLEDKIREAILRQLPQNKPSQGSAPRGGIQFTVDPPRTAPSSAHRQAEQQHKIAREAQHQAWLEQRRQAINEQRQQEAERRRRRIEEEQKIRQERYNAIYTTEYMREGPSAQRKSDIAHWRTHEGAQILNETHTAQMLMTASSVKEFGHGTRTSTHTVQPLKRRRPIGLSPDAIPWATMAADARPWSEWTNKVQKIYLDPELSDSSINAPKTMLTANEQWNEMTARLGESRMEQIRYALVDACGKNIPSLYYDESNGRYVVYSYDSHKIITIAPDGSSMTTHQLTEKDDSISNIWNNIQKTSYVSGSFNAVDAISSKVGLSLNSEKMVEYEFKVKGVGGNISNTGWSIDAGNASLSSDYNGEKRKLEVSKSADFEIQDKKEPEKDNNTSTKKKDLLTAELNARITAYENSSSIKHSKIWFADDISSPSFGAGWQLGAGLTVKGSAKAYMKANDNIKHGAEVGGEVTLANAGINGTVMFRPTLYKGMCFATVDVKADLGYKYKYKSKGGKKSDKSFEKGRNPGSYPVFLSGAGSFRCYSPEETKLNFNDKKDTVNE